MGFVDAGDDAMMGYKVDFETIERDFMWRGQMWVVTMIVEYEHHPDWTLRYKDSLVGYDVCEFLDEDGVDRHQLYVDNRHEIDDIIDGVL